jgi:H+/Cl- antiporter ClcA
VVRWVLLGVASGLLAGLASAAFLEALDAVTRLRLDHPALVWFLPLAGLAVGGAYHLFGGRAGEGSGLLIDEIHEPTAWVPRRMAPMVGLGTLVSHLFGASVGREGTALQMSGSLSDLLGRTVRLGSAERRVLLVTSLAAGFGAMFGVPLAGTAFALEVQAVRPSQGELLRRARTRSSRWPRSPRWAATAPLAGLAGRWRALAYLAVPSLTAALVGHAVVQALLPNAHRPLPALHAALDASVWARLAVAGVVFGLVAVAFVTATDGVRHLSRRLVRWDPARPVLGGLVVLAGVALVGRDHLGLSLPLAHQALLGHDTDLTVPLLKLVFTAVCLGSGFIGGEVTPLFVIGATAGSALGALLGLDPVLGAAVGYVAVFAGAANAPVACTVMAAEVFGAGAMAPAAVVCAVAYLCSGHRGIYPTQRVVTADGVVRRREL